MFAFCLGGSRLYRRILLTTNVGWWTYHSDGCYPKNSHAEWLKTDATCSIFSHVPRIIVPGLSFPIDEPLVRIWA